MKRIMLDMGEVCVVDDAWYGVLNEYGWCCSYMRGKRYRYVMRGVSVDGVFRRVMMGRLVAGVPMGWSVGYRDGDGMNVRGENLAVYDSGGYYVEGWEFPGAPGVNGHEWRGVHWDGYYGLWCGRIGGMVVPYADEGNGVLRRYFESKVEAGLAWNYKMIELYGDSGELNDVSCLRGGRRDGIKRWGLRVREREEMIERVKDGK